MGKVKQGRLLLRWSETEDDWLVSFPNKPDGALALNQFCYPPLPGADKNSFIEELKRRGYDTKTLRFSVDRKKQ